MQPLDRRRRRRLASALGVLTVIAMALAPAAMAADGVGLYGRTDDKVITYFCFGVMAFFAILVTTLSLIQIRLEHRKDRRKEDLERLDRS